MPSDCRDRSPPSPVSPETATPARATPTLAKTAPATPAQARRRFLAQCGRFAAATPPAVTLLLAAADRRYVAAQSALPAGGTRTDYDNGSWIVRYPDGSYFFGRGADGAAPPGIPPGLGG